MNRYDFSIPDLLTELEMPEDKNSGFSENPSFEGSYKFTGTKNFKENYEFFLKGFPCKTEFNTDFLENNLQVLKPVNTFFMSNESIYNLYDVAEYCNGNPDFWIQCMPIETEIQTVNIYFSSTFSWTIENHTIQKYGEIIYFSVKHLLDKNFNVNLYSYVSLNDRNKSNHLFITEIKNSNYNLDIDRLKYFLLCPSFFRRTIFKVIENRPDLRRKLGESFGSCNYEKPKLDGIIFPSIQKNEIDSLKILKDTLKDYL